MNTKGRISRMAVLLNNHNYCSCGQFQKLAEINNRRRKKNAQGTAKATRQIRESRV